MRMCNVSFHHQVNGDCVKIDRVIILSEGFARVHLLLTNTLLCAIQLIISCEHLLLSMEYWYTMLTKILYLFYFYTFLKIEHLDSIVGNYYLMPWQTCDFNHKLIFLILNNDLYCVITLYIHMHFKYWIVWFYLEISMLESECNNKYLWFNKKKKLFWY